MRSPIGKRRSPSASICSIAKVSPPGSAPNFRTTQILVHCILGNGDENGEGSSGDEDADASDEAADGSDTSGTQDPQDDVEMGESAIGQ